MPASRLFVLALLLLVLAAPALTGCGKKAWPEPVRSEDRFGFSEPRAALAGGCLTVEADLAGAAGNLQEVVLEMGPADCPDCPLRPDAVVRFTDRAGFMADADTVSVKACGLAPDAPVRWRMRGINALSRQSAASTKVMITEPSPAAQ